MESGQQTAAPTAEPDDAELVQAVLAGNVIEITIKPLELPL
jgi:hypothetical protein